MWFSTTEKLGKAEDQTLFETRILKELNEKKDEENLNPAGNAESRRKFLERFDWIETLLSQAEKQAVENNLVEYHDVFARQKMDIGVNTEFKVKLTPKDDKAVCSQNLPRLFYLKKDLIVKLALANNNGTITVLPFSKEASPIFAQRQPNRKLRLLVDLRKINTLFSNAYTDNNQPVSTLADATKHLAGKFFFCRLGCSQAYNSLQMADQRSMKMLVFLFTSKIFAYKRLA